MKDVVEFVCILYHSDIDIEELEKHLIMNGYYFGIDRGRHFLFVPIEEVDYVETILKDRSSLYHIIVG